jgi:superoxide dismutase, Fe-Mn family
MKFELPKLPYEYGALEPYIDAKTMEIHHTKHHQAYIDKLNPVVEKYPELANMEVEALLKNLSSLKVDEADRKVIQNHGGGHANHSMFWKLMDPANKLDEKLVADIKTTFGSVEDFKKQFSDTALKVFGSGWAWLVKDVDNKLSILGLPNQDSPLSQGLTPVLGLDVWEHAYYLKYQNKRADYINTWWNVIKLI